MKMLTLASLFLSLSPCLHAAEAKDFNGTLYRRGSEKKELLFTLKAERKADLWADRYVDATGAEAVTERVFLKDGKAERYEFDDKQQQGLGTLVVEAKKLQLSWVQDGKTKTKTVDRPDNLTFGPLYPELLRQNFDKLLKGEKIFGTVPVLSKDRLMTAELAFQRKPKLEHGDGKICISMKPANWFVALFFPPIDLYFNEKTQVLEDVHGMSLLKEKSGNEWKMTEVDLFYDFQ
jgi:hypothetical protein